MRIKLLGTAAAEGIPAFYCGCRVCANARMALGREVRTRCGALIDGRIKIDLPPDTLCQLHREGLDARDWSALFFTHSHDDHFAIDELQYGVFPFNSEEALGFSIFADAQAAEKIAARYPDWPFDLETMRAFEPVRFAEYTVTPIKARHMEEEEALNLIFQDGSTTFLYATDTGVWAAETWEFLAGIRLDALAMECTAGTSDDSYWGHHTLKTFLETIDRLRGSGILKPNSKVVSTHHSHQGEMTYAEHESELSGYGILAGYDGFEFKC